MGARVRAVRAVGGFWGFLLSRQAASLCSKVGSFSVPPHTSTGFPSRVPPRARRWRRDSLQPDGHEPRPDVVLADQC